MKMWLIVRGEADIRPDRKCRGPVNESTEGEPPDNIVRFGIPRNIPVGNSVIFSYFKAHFSSRVVGIFFHLPFKEKEFPLWK